MSISEIGGRQFPLRRSSRLLGKIRRSLCQLGKPAVTLKQLIKSSIRKSPKTDHDLFPGPCTYITRGGTNAERFMRTSRKSVAFMFRHKYIYDDSIDKRVYINSSGNTDTWTDRSTGCMWVAVQGTHSISVAVRETLDKDRYPGYSESMFRRSFFLNVVSEIEDITLSTSDSRQTLDKHVTKPFGVVSVIQNTTTNGQESGDEASDALKYLKKRFGSGLAFNLFETTQTAISALQCLCNQELKANDIWVCVLDMDGGEYHFQREQLEKHLVVVNKKPLQSEEIKERLAVINNHPLLTDEIEEQGAPSTGSEPCLPQKDRAKPLVSPQTRKVLTPINVSLDMGSPLRSITNIMKNQDAEEEVNLMKNKSAARVLTTSQASKRTSSGKGVGRADKENVQRNPLFLPR